MPTCVYGQNHIRLKMLRDLITHWPDETIQMHSSSKNTVKLGLLGS